MTNFNTLSHNRPVSLVCAIAIGVTACTPAETSQPSSSPNAAASHKWPEPKCTGIIPKMDTRDPQTFHFEVVTEDIDMKDGYTLHNVDYHFDDTTPGINEPGGTGAIRQSHTFEEGGKTYKVSATLVVEGSPDAPPISRDNTINCPETKVLVP